MVIDGRKDNGDPTEGRFQWPRTEDEARKLSAEEFNRLMEGYSIDSSIGSKRPTERPDPRSLRKG